MSSRFKLTKEVNFIMSVIKNLKYVMVAGLVVALSFAPASKAIAAVTGESEQSEQSGPTQEELREQARQEEVTRKAEEFVAEATAPVNKTVAGVQSQVGGYYTAKEVNGVALAPAAGTSAAGSFVKVTDTDKSKSSAAVATATTVAASLSPAAIVGPCINVNYGQNVNGKVVDSTTGSAGTLSVGIPASFQTQGANYAVVAVYAGGAFKIYPNASTNPAVVTVAVDEATSANVMYALVKY